MSVKKDGDARRFVELEVELPGTPEEVWQAIATGPGISSWFVPTDVEEREGGALVFHLGEGMDSTGRVTAWEPPRRFAYEEREWLEKAPPLATECVVETRSGGLCVVRMVHSLFTSSEEWDDQLESSEKGWPPFFEVLRLYFRHFKGIRGSSIRLMATAPDPEPTVWKSLMSELGFSDADIRTGQEVRTKLGAPVLSGVIERTGSGEQLHELVMRLNEPAPGIAVICVAKWAEQVHPTISLYLYGEQANALLAREQVAWEAWVNERFPMTEGSGVGA